MKTSSPLISRLNFYGNKVVRTALLFCGLAVALSLQAQTPTVADLQATGSNIKWYLTPTGGTALLSTTPLVHGQHYYASQTVSGVESLTRTDVVANLSTQTAPTGGTHTATQTQIIWHWNAASGASGYKWNTVNTYSSATDMGTSTSKTETGLTCGTSYTRYIWAYNSSGCKSTAVTLTKSTSSCEPEQTDFLYTGAMQTFTVPAGITSVTIEAWGAQGWSGSYSGGKGGYAKGNLAVTSGQTLYIFVGGQGTAAVGEGIPSGAGWNGGGLGQTNASPNSAGGGGGASDVRVGGTALANRVIVAGGGGGSTNNSSCSGGDGGGTTGSKGGGSYGGGYGGTQTEGGSFGGSLGQGGNALVAYTPWNGGGGGGYYGGGTSDAHGSGGGGSSYTGGVTSASTTAGLRSGNGRVLITY